MAFKKYLAEMQYNIRLSIPVIIGLLGHTFVAFVDNIMVGQLGTAELAAVSLGNSFIFIGLSIVIGFSTAITPLTAEADGEGDINKKQSILRNALILCLINGIIVSSLILGSIPLLHKMNQPSEVVILAIPFLFITSLSLIPIAIFQGFKQFTDGMSATRYAMYATLCGNVLNIIFDYLLIFGNFGFPRMGIIGAAFATLGSRIVMVLFMWMVLRWLPRFANYVRVFDFRKIQIVIIKKIIALGIPSALQMFSEIALFAGAIWLSGVLGKNPQAANQIVLNLTSITFMVTMGLSTTAMVRVGNQKGLLNFVRLKHIAFSIFILTLVVDVIFAGCYFIFNDWLPTLYLDQNNSLQAIDNKEVILLASQLLVIAGFFQIFDGMQVVTIGALRGLQDVKVPTVIVLFSYLIVGYGTSYYLGLHTSFATKGIWIGLLVSLTSAAILLFIRFYRLSKRLINLQKIS